MRFLLGGKEKAQGWKVAKPIFVRREQKGKKGSSNHGIRGGEGRRKSDLLSGVKLDFH